VRVDSSTGRAPSRAVIAFSIGAVVLFWALNFIAAKIGLRTLPALAMSSFRVVAAGAIMVPMYFLCRRLPAFAPPAGEKRAAFAARDLWAFFYLGFFAVVVNQLCFTIGLDYTSVGHAAVIVGMGPIYTLILAVLLRIEKASWHKATGMAVAFAGMALLAADNGISSGSSSLLGDLITMTGSLGFATYAVLGKRVAGRYDPLTMTAFNHFAGGLMVLPLAIREARLLGPLGGWATLPWQTGAAILYMALFGSAVAYVLYFWLLRYLEPSQLSAFTYLLPISATIMGIIWLGERGSWIQLGGGAIALFGVYWVESGRQS